MQNHFLEITFVLVWYTTLPPTIKSSGNYRCARKKRNYIIYFVFYYRLGFIQLSCGSLQGHPMMVGWWSEGEDCQSITDLSICKSNSMGKQVSFLISGKISIAIPEIFGCFPWKEDGLRRTWFPILKVGLGGHGPQNFLRMMDLLFSDRIHPPFPPSPSPTRKILADNTNELTCGCFVSTFEFFLTLAKEQSQESLKWK